MTRMALSHWLVMGVLSLIPSAHAKTPDGSSIHGQKIAGEAAILVNQAGYDWQSAKRALLRNANHPSKTFEILNADTQRIVSRGRIGQLTSDPHSLDRIADISPMIARTMTVPSPAARTSSKMVKPRARRVRQEAHPAAA